jgi:hypothetical protein
MSPAETMRKTLAAWPRGYFTAAYNGRRYGVTLTSHAGGRSLKLYAEELGGPDIISLNLYTPAHTAPTLRPCEMPLAKVTAFVRDAVPTADG